MNPLVEKLTRTRDAEFWQAAGRFQRAAEKDPRSWEGQLLAACTEAGQIREDAQAACKACIARLEDPDVLGNELETVKAKAAAWDAHCLLQHACAVYDVLIEQRADVAYILATIEAQGKATWEKFKAERAHKRELQAARALA